MPYHYISPATSTLLSHLKCIWEKDGTYYITNDQPTYVKPDNGSPIHLDISVERAVKRSFDDSYQLGSANESAMYHNFSSSHDVDDSYMLFQNRKQPLKMSRDKEKLEYIIKELSFTERLTGSVEIDGNTWTFPKLIH